jgi:chromosome segregation ATPase
MKKRFDSIRDEFLPMNPTDNGDLLENIRQLIRRYKQAEVAHQDVTNKYQALLLQANMLTDMIKQHSNEVANHKSNEEQLKEFNEQLLNENQKVKLHIQEVRSKLSHLTQVNSQCEHESNLLKQRVRELQIQCDASKTEQQLLVQVENRRNDQR